MVSSLKNRGLGDNFRKSKTYPPLFQGFSFFPGGYVRIFQENKENLDLKEKLSTDCGKVVNKLSFFPKKPGKKREFPRSFIKNL